MAFLTARDRITLYEKKLQLVENKDFSQKDIKGNVRKSSKR